MKKLLLAGIAALLLATGTAHAYDWRWWADRRCKTPEEYKAWAQNLGHEDVLTTFRSYGDVNSYRQAEIMQSFASPSLGTPS